MKTRPGLQRGFDVGKEIRQAMSQGPDDEALYFRFYDPRVLESFLPTCSEEQLDEFFGSLTALGVWRSAEEGATLLLRGGVGSGTSGS